ncbi:MAG: hypothetical protein NT135_00090 [Candidatus Berkelbacteria bacterium]|nr:hypothetical protein [Candidatus Berkelbacteria bacterium]
MKFTVDDVIKKDLLDLMELNHLPDAEKKELYEKAMETVQNRLLIVIASKLNEKDKEEFFKLIDKEDAKVVDDFLKSKGIDYQSLFTEEVLLYKMEMAKKAQMVK